MITNPYRQFHAKPRDLCPVCGERPAKPETEICAECEADAQANVVDLDDERETRELERLFEGDEG